MTYGYTFEILFAEFSSSKCFCWSFFVISFWVASPHLVEINPNNVFSIGLPFALIAGVTVYGLHRSLFYPLVEWGCNSKWAENLREKIAPLVSKNSVGNFARLWDSKSKKGTDKLFQRGEQIANWADYIHLQYVSAWCIILGAFSSSVISGGCHTIYWPLFCLAAIFFFAAVISNWRLFSVQQLLKHFPPTKE